VLYILFAESLPDDFALIIGDVLHNLKASLDFAVNDVFFRRFGKFSPHTRFPVRDTRDELIAAVHGGTIYQASKAVGDFIVEVVKPYKGGNNALWTLHDLNIRDKHILLLPTMRVTALNGVCVEFEGGRKHKLGLWVITGHGRVIMQEFPGERNVKIADYGKPTLHVLFDKGLPVEGKAVIPALHQLTEAVSGTLEGIESVFLAENS
jgi:hypothetical protein